MISQNNNYSLNMFFGDKLRLQVNDNPLENAEFETFKIILLRVRECNDRIIDVIKDLDETRSCYTANQKSLIRRYKKFHKWFNENKDKDFICIAMEEHLWAYLSPKNYELFIQSSLSYTLSHRYYSNRQIKFFTDFDLIPLPPNYTKKMVRVFIRDYILSKTTFPLYESDYPGRNIF